MDIDRVKDITEGPSAGKIRWGDAEDPDATVAFRTEGDADLSDAVRPSRLRLQYTTTKPRTGESQEHDYTVQFDYTECNFGGYRPWFLCPACGDRRGKLYLPPGRERFACRECYDLGYLSSRRSGDDVKQAELRYRRAFEKADKDDRRPHPSNPPYLPDRPKGMHHSTFEELTDTVRDARREFDDAHATRSRELLENLKSDVRAPVHQPPNDRDEH